MEAKGKGEDGGDDCVGARAERRSAGLDSGVWSEVPGEENSVTFSPPF